MHAGTTMHLNTAEQHLCDVTKLMVPVASLVRKRSRPLSEA